MAAPFNQTVSCNSGIKPYENPDRSGDWTAAFDGTNLTLNSFNAGEPFGGALDGAERENYSGAALLRKDLGASNGTVYFTRTLAGTVISTGHHKFGGSSPRSDTVECGQGMEGPWIDPAPNNPFRFENDTLTWVAGIAPLNCAQRNSGGSFGAMTASNVIASESGGKLDVTNGSSSLIVLQSATDPSRTNTVVANSPSLAPGGARVWQSAGTDSTVTIDVRFDNLVRRISQTAGGVETYCAPSPLDPRF